MKRILFILHLPPPVHGAAAIGEMIRRSPLVNERFECRFINLSTSTSLGEIGKFSLKKISTILSLWKKISHEIRTFRPQLVYLTPSATGMGFRKDWLLSRIVKWRKTPLLVHFHNKGVSEARSPFDTLLYRSFFKATKVILISERLYPDIERYVKPEDVYFCPNGMDLPVEGTVCREKQPPVLLFLSNLLIAKGILTLLDACTILRRRSVPFQLRVAGGKTFEMDDDRLNAEIRSRSLEDCVTYCGWAGEREKAALFGQSDLFVFPSHNETFGLVLLEAMAWSLPVVATREGGIPDVVVPGENGLLVPSKDPEALADALEQLLSDPALRQEMGEHGRQRYMQQFTETAFIERFVSILSSLL